ncbi:class F sortase [Nonomuraea jiangxiensis]|uniref:LPXTG-site transpeptidase (Sortase) family protein n=1 Tax=Nonomuraea jiangxiensis TaxID=633440 RepID=A0A1G9TY66_9ACTN|nr:class F sortase [Nonomuraea jiangxiensis]SDM52622.1 LPXTG-site transpeptidase (sortase) family protein [Nonomuraea jiangxiensis]
MAEQDKAEQPEQPEKVEKPEKPEQTPMQRALPGLLVAGSLGGVGIVMVSLLSLAPQVDDGSESLAAAKTEPTKVEVANAGAFVLPATVGPGGENVPLTAARLDAPPPLAAAPFVSPFTPPKTKTAKAKAKPIRIKIPKIKVNAPIGAVGMTKGELGVPPLSKPGLTGWYNGAPLPGEIGPAVINGHVSTRKGPAVFERLRELSKGDQIYVYRSDKKVARFTVSGIEQAGKTSFPTSRVYGSTNDSQLRLITCGGVFNSKAHSYTDNIIVYATLSKKKG